jgi:hypothetical protein
VLAVAAAGLHAVAAEPDARPAEDAAVAAPPAAEAVAAMVARQVVVAAAVALRAGLAALVCWAASEALHPAAVLAAPRHAVVAFGRAAGLARHPDGRARSAPVVHLVR